jgi:uncharacterized protein YjbJ (UPF0337 family)
MDRRRIEGTLKRKTASIKGQYGLPIGDHHIQAPGTLEKTEDCVRSDGGKAMDAVREVVENEENKETLGKTDGRLGSGVNKAMDAVREVVENEKGNG